MRVSPIILNGYEARGLFTSPSNFDVKKDVVRDGEIRKVKDYAFLNVGHCVHIDVLKTFMREHNVGFQEG
jgi:hypothetical protein